MSVRDPRSLQSNATFRLSVSLDRFPGGFLSPRLAAYSRRVEAIRTCRGARGSGRSTSCFMISAYDPLGRVTPVAPGRVIAHGALDGPFWRRHDP